MEETTSRRRRSAPAAADGATGAAPAAKPDAAAEEPRKPTKRVVLRQERVIVLPDDVADDTLAKLSKGEGAKALADLLGLKSAKVPTADIGREMWLVVGEFEGQDKDDAIRAHAGEPGSPDAIPGTYKAPPINGWKGGKRYTRPDRPKVEAENID